MLITKSVLSMCFAVRYRKVAADRCVDSDVTSVYNPVAAACQVIAPRDLAVEVVAGEKVAVSTIVEFQLIQEEVLFVQCFVLLIESLIKINNVKLYPDFLK